MRVPNIGTLAALFSVAASTTALAQTASADTPPARDTPRIQAYPGISQRF